MLRLPLALITLLLLAQMVSCAPIHETVKQGNMQTMEQLLAADHAQVSILDDNGYNPLTLAITANNPETCKVLLDYGADPNQRLIPKASVTEEAPKVRRGTTALHLFANTALDLPTATDQAAQARFTKTRDAHTACLKLLLAAKADVTAVDDNGNTPLHTAVLASNNTHPNLETIQLLATKATVNLKDGHGESPLFAAVQVQQYDAAKLLVAAGADVNLADQDGETPLHKAVAAGNRMLVELLLNAKADPALANKAGKTPRQLAADQQDALLAKLFDVK